HALFIPRDHRIPRIRVPLTQCPKDFQKSSEEPYPDLFFVEIVEWKATTHFALGKVLRRFGREGEIDSETQAILAEYQVDTSPFSDQILKDLPSDWQISKKQLKCRKDLRSSCIFTIDPATAKDLDDALSCEPLENGNFEVGVHIADVSYFVRENTPVDTLASKRTLTFYLVQKAITMLPPALCENYCSLNPGEDRLTFSVVWELTPNGKIVKEWFGKSVIHSCCKMNYDHAQSVLDNPSKTWTSQDFPQIYGDHTVSKIVSVILNLNKIAQELLKGRLSSGAIELNQPKQWFSLDSDSGYPTSCKTYEMKESNGLVKEFMLLANISVAKKILTGFTSTAFLRRQPSPCAQMISKVTNYCKNFDIHCDGDNYRSLQASLLAIGTNDKDGIHTQAVSHIFLRAMTRAEYFCSGTFESHDSFKHYCLNIPLYTHFTSPIRRYPDIIVHRQLFNLLEGKSQDNSMITNTAKLESIAKVCNERKLAQFNVGKKSSELFFSFFVRSCEPLHEDAIAISLLDSSFDVLLVKYGLVKRVYCNNVHLESWKLTRVRKKAKLILYWK
ncbi:uncharacterized protein TRIADDRAFT_10828, partial [Trichoplax adhaerens]